MALDFMAAKNKQDAMRSTFLYPMEEPEFEALMTLVDSPKKYPTIYRFSDYYKDATILFGEIAALLRELEALERLNPGKLPADSPFHQFLREVQRQQHNIYIFCD